jgi:hypothetical protein
MSIKALHLFRLFFVILLFAGMNFAFAATTPPTGNAINATGTSVPADVKGAGGKNPFSFNITLGFPATISDKNEVVPAPVVRDSNAYASEENMSRARIYEYGANAELGAIPARHHTNAALRQAMNLDVDLVYIHLNAFADFDGAATDIRNKLTEFNRPMTVFIDNGSKGNGAIISLRTDSSDKGDHQNQVKTSIYNLKENQFHEKYTRYVNAIVSHSVKKNIQEPSTAPPSTAIIQPSPLGPTKPSFASRPSVLAASNIVLYNYQPSFLEQILDFLLQPFVSFLLIFVIGLGLLLEFRNPGTGFPLFASVAASLLFFIPLHIDGFADMPEIVLFVIGLSFVLTHRIWPVRTSYFAPAGFCIAGVALIFCLSPSFLLTTFITGGWKLIIQPFVIVSSAFLTITFVYHFMIKQVSPRKTKDLAGTDSVPKLVKAFRYPA